MWWPDQEDLASAGRTAIDFTPVGDAIAIKEGWDENDYLKMGLGGAALGAGLLTPWGKPVIKGGAAAYRAGKPYVEQGARAIGEGYTAAKPYVEQGARAVGNTIWDGTKWVGRQLKAANKFIDEAAGEVAQKKAIKAVKPRALTDRQMRMRSLEDERKGITGAFGRSHKRELKQDYQDSLKDFETWDAANKLRNMGIRPGGWTK